jgi:hypothetical protein
LFYDAAESRNEDMQVHRTKDDVNGIIRTTITGEISLGDALADITRRAADPSYDSHLPTLVDMRDAHSCMTADEIVALAQKIKSDPQRAEGGRRALLVNTALMYGLARMFEAFAGGGTVQYRLFEDETKALAWLTKK